MHPLGISVEMLCAEGGIRTHGLILTKDTLCQLSYDSMCVRHFSSNCLVWNALGFIRGCDKQLLAALVLPWRLCRLPTHPSPADVFRFGDRNALKLCALGGIRTHTD